MAASTVLLLFCCFLSGVYAADKKVLTVTCGPDEDCVLPCRFQSDGKGARVMWWRKKAVVSCTRYGNTSFVTGRHNHPAEMYVGRTDLFDQQVLEGNATLVLRNVTPSDEGKYFCITMTAPKSDGNESGVIEVIVEAPVRDVIVQLSGDTVSCWSEGIYPEPSLSWSLDPPSDSPLIHRTAAPLQNRTGFFQVQSSLRLTRNISTGHAYICTVTSDLSTKTAVLKEEDAVMVPEGGGAKILCRLPASVLQMKNVNASVTWTFGCCDPVTSISDSDETLTVWPRWRPHVFSNFSLWSGLQLHSLRAELQGNYTCKVSMANHTYSTWTDVSIAQEPHQSTYIIVIITLAFLLFSACIALILVGEQWWRLDQARQERERQEGTTVTLNTDSANSDSTNSASDNANAQDAPGFFLHVVLAIRRKLSG